MLVRRSQARADIITIHLRLSVHPLVSRVFGSAGAVAGAKQASRRAGRATRARFALAFA